MMLVFGKLLLFSLVLIYIYHSSCEENDQAADMMETPTAKVLIHKFSDVNPVVEGRDFIVTYSLYNLGNAAATDLEVGDKYDINSFEPIHNVKSDGNVGIKLEELAPGAQYSFNTTVRPKLYGIYESTKAIVRYSATIAMDGLDPEMKQGMSSSLGRVKIISTKEFNRNTTFFTIHGFIFLILYSVPTLLPLYLWRKSVLKMQVIMNKSN